MTPRHRTAATLTLALLLLLTAGVLAVATANKADATTRARLPLSAKIVVCRTAEDGIHATRLPCVWQARRQGDQLGHSLVAYPRRPGIHRLGLVRWVDDTRAEFLWLAATSR